MNKNADVIIIGSGLIGCSTAYFLTKSGRSVIVIERNEPCCGASGANSGILGLHTKLPGLKMDMAIDSIGMYRELADDLPIDCELELDRGCALVCQDEQTFIETAEECRKEAFSRINIKMLKGDDFRQIEPAISPKIYGAKYTPEGGMVNAMLLNWGLHDRAEGLGAKFYFHTSVVSFIRKGRRVMGVVTDRGDEFYADWVIDCTGSWSGLTNKLLGLNIDVTPRRGQTIVTEAVGPMLRTCLADGNIVKRKYHPELFEGETPKLKRLGYNFGGDQTKNGNIVLSATREFAGFDKTNTLEGIETVLHFAKDIIPAIQGMRFIHTYAGFRPFPPDGKPLIGIVHELEGYAISAGHEGDGVAMTPLSGWLMLQALDGVHHRYLDELTPDRLVPKGSVSY